MRYFLMTLAAALALTMFTAADSQAKPGRPSGGRSGREVQKKRHHHRHHHHRYDNGRRGNRYDRDGRRNDRDGRRYDRDGRRYDRDGRDGRDGKGGPADDDEDYLS
jgi:hypothetical protein